MKKILFLFTLTAAMLLVFAACGENAAEESNTAEQTTPTTQTNLQDNQASGQASQPASAEILLQTEQDETLNRIRANNEWIADIMSEWSDELGMSADEIFDYVRAATILDYGFDYGIEGGMDVSELAAGVGLSSVEFMNMVHIAYSSTRSVDVAHRWAAELDMTAYELVDYVFGGNDSHHLSDALGVEWGEFQTVLSGVGNALWSERVRAHTNAETVAIASGWANELGMTLDEFVDYYNSFDRDIIATAELLGVDVTDLTLAMSGAIAFLYPGE